MRVKDFMSRRVIAVSMTARVQEAAALLKKHSIRHLPVVQDGRLIGLVTEGDLRGAMWPSVVEDIRVKDLMITESRRDPAGNDARRGRQAGLPA